MTHYVWYAVGAESKRHVIYRQQANPLDGENWMLKRGDPDGWIHWEGGECPLPSEVRVRVRTRNGVECPLPVHTGNQRWGHGGGQYDIIAYRPILDTEPSEPQAPEWTIGERCIWQLGDVCMGEHVILAKDGDTYWIRDDHGGYDMADREELRPIRTPAQQAEDAMVSVAVENNLLMSPDGAKSIYAAIRDGKIPGVKLEDEP